MFVVAVIDDQGKPVAAVRPSPDRDASEQHRDKLRLPAGWTANVVPLREPITTERPTRAPLPPRRVAPDSSARMYEYAGLNAFA